MPIILLIKLALNLERKEKRKVKKIRIISFFPPFLL